MFSRPYRRARAAEGVGDYRRAAALYVEAELPEDAANALLFHAARAGTLEERLSAFHEALRWLPDAHARRAEVEAQIGLAVLDDARRRGARSSEEKRRLADAATRLEGADRPGDAANAWELLERWDDAARCLEAAGEVERLEALLDRTGEADNRRRQMRGLVADYEMAMAVGARSEARDALRSAVALDPEDGAVADLLRRLEARFPRPYHVALSIDGRRIVAFGRLPVVLGRTGADIVLRGASVSRRHAELDIGPEGQLLVRDLDSRNGTLVRGLPIAGEVTLSGQSTVGLGDDVTVRVSPLGPEAVRLDVDQGLDRGAVILIGRGQLPIPDAPGSVSFPDGHATVGADKGTALVLATQACAMPILVLDGDRLELGPHTIEVVL
jgi:pSer/pThr/pTyr-binding forkhead associated (FHA) protein